MLSLEDLNHDVSSENLCSLQGRARGEALAGYIHPFIRAIDSFPQQKVCQHITVTDFGNVVNEAKWS